MGYMDEIIDAVLNHVKKGVIAIYNRHKYDKEKRKHGSRHYLSSYVRRGPDVEHVDDLPAAVKTESRQRQ